MADSPQCMCLSDHLSSTFINASLYRDTIAGWQTFFLLLQNLLLAVLRLAKQNNAALINCNVQQENKVQLNGMLRLMDAPDGNDVLLVLERLSWLLVKLSSNICTYLKVCMCVYMHTYIYTALARVITIIIICGNDCSLLGTNICSCHSLMSEVYGLKYLQYTLSLGK